MLLNRFKNLKEQKISKLKGLFMIHTHAFSACTALAITIKNNRNKS